MTEWETITIPRGTYYAWGNEPGQQVVGKVLTYKARRGHRLQRSYLPDT